MNFCENCNLACQDERCPKCGRKKLRAVHDDDFCFVARVDRALGDHLKFFLDNEKIACVLMPYGTGVRAKFALPSESYLLYVQYENLESVRQILQELQKSNI